MCFHTQDPSQVWHIGGCKKMRGTGENNLQATSKNLWATAKRKIITNIQYVNKTNIYI